MNVTTNERDDWDQHWAQFAEAAEIGPTPRYRSELIHSLLDFPAPGTSIRFLEIGSGTGEFAEKFCGAYPAARYLGIELSRTGVEISQRRVPSARFMQRNLLEAPLSDEHLDYAANYALCSEVLEHLENPSQLLRAAQAYCAPGCRLIVTVPGGPMNAFYQHIGHRRHYSPATLSQLLETSGFQVEKAFGAGFPFFNLFRTLIAMRGSKAVADFSGPPSLSVKVGSSVFGTLFRLNSRSSGWQTMAIARSLGG